MKDKLLVWIGGTFFHFCVAKYISDNYDADIYAIIDTDDEKKTFFEKQKLISFKNFWFYRDHVDVHSKNKFDLDYLIDFEKRTGINLWNIAYSERTFYNFNDYYHFSHDEILSILEQECKHFEKILDETQPNFLIIGTTDSHHNYLLSEICKSRKINILMSGAARFGYKEMISSDVDVIDDISPEYNDIKFASITFEELQEYYEKTNFADQIKKFKKILQPTKKQKIQKFLKLFFIYSDKKYQNHFVHKGITRWNILTKLPILEFNRRKVKKFVQKQFVKNFNVHAPYIYFPLHSEPERALSISAPYFTNQIETITNIAKSIPIDYKLLVKDHPIMDIKGGRSLEFYKKIQKLPNVILIHPSIPQTELIKNSSMVITIAGTGGMEASMYGIPSIALAYGLFNTLPSVLNVNNIEELPKLIRTWINTKVHPFHFRQFIDYVEQHSFNVDRHTPASDIRVRFHHKSINENEMKKFMNDYDEELNIFSSNYIKKINEANSKK